MVHKSSSLATGGGTGGGISSINGDTTAAQIIAAGSGISVGTSAGTTTISAIGGGSGTVTSVSGITANGFAFSVANATTTPAITAIATPNGILQSNGSAMSAVAAGGISTSLLASSAVTIGAVSGLVGGGSVVLGSSITIGIEPNQTYREVTFNLDGQASAISAISGYQTWYIANTPYAGTITGWSLVADQSGSIDIDVWKANASIPTVVNTITASAQCSLASSQSMFNGPITGWSSAISKGDCWAFNLISAATLTKANLTIQVTAS